MTDSHKDDPLSHVLASVGADTKGVSKRKKVTVVGAGNVGMACVMSIINQVQ